MNIRKTYIIKSFKNKQFWLQEKCICQMIVCLIFFLIVSVSCMTGISTELISGSIGITVRSGESTKTGESTSEFFYRVSE